MKKALKILALFLMILLLLITAGIVRSYGWPVINTQEIRSDKIQSSKRICVISDLHSKHFSTLVSQIRDQNPELILMAGDIFDADDTELDTTFATVEILTGICDVYFALGNHEMKQIEKSDTFISRLEETGVKIIDKKYFDIGDDLRIGGMYQYPFGWNKKGRNTADSASDDVQEFMGEFVDTDRFLVFGAHRPESFYFSDASKAYSIDLVVSAHIHGGQVVIPFFGGLYGGDQRWFPKYVHGYYKRNNICWLITSGLSTSKKILPRFNNPPEIYIVDLMPE